MILVNSDRLIAILHLLGLSINLKVSSSFIGAYIIDKKATNTSDSLCIKALTALSSFWKFKRLNMIVRTIPARSIKMDVKE